MVVCFFITESDFFMSTAPEQVSGKIFDGKILGRIYGLMQPYIGRFYLLVFLTIILAILAPSRPYLIQYAIDHPVAEGDLPGLGRMVIWMVILTVLQSLFQWLYTYLSGWMGQQLIKDLRLKLYRHILNLRLQFFDRTPIGRLVTRNISDIETLSEVSNSFAAIVGDILQLAVLMGMMFYTDWRLSLVSLATFPLMLLSTYVFKEKMKNAFTEVRNAVASFNTFVQEHITGMSVVQIFGSETRELRKFKDINKEHLRANLKTVLYFSIYFPVAEVISALATGLVVWYGAAEVLHDEVTFGTLVAFIMYISLFFRPVRMLADRFNTLQMGVVSSDRIFKLLDNDEYLQGSGQKTLGDLTGEVAFDHVWFGYEQDRYVLKDIHFTVKPGETVAFVGATGAGKSSIINLLNRFYEIQQGHILVDGTDIREYRLDDLRAHIGIVLQDVFLFSDSIEYNISLGNPDISREQILRTAEMVGAREFIEKLPGGLDYNVMERGATLSVGQRQLISFVRALVYDPRVIVLDEATSSVDSETEELIQQAIEKAMKGRTAIIIAHRLATIQKADKIIVLDKGEIKEIGTHEELLEKDGYYAHLYRIQYKQVA